MKSTKTHHYSGGRDKKVTCGRSRSCYHYIVHETQDWNKTTCLNCLRHKPKCKERSD